MSPDPSALDTTITNINTNGTIYFRSNSIGPGASATGTNALAMGSNAQSSGLNAIAIGTNSQATQTGAIAMGFGAQATGVNAIAIGANANATGSVAMGSGAQASNGGAAYGDGAVATGALSAAVGPNAVATAPNAVALGNGSIANQANTVSVGTPGNERRITNVATGINPTDAVNVSQLQGVASGFQSQLSAMSSTIESVDQRARRGIVAASAITSPPMPSAPGKITWAANTAFYSGEAGFGASLAYRLNTPMPLYLSGSYSNGGGSEHIVRAGIGGEF